MSWPPNISIPNSLDFIALIFGANLHYVSNTHNSKKRLIENKKDKKKNGIKEKDRKAFLYGIPFQMPISSAKEGRVWIETERHR